MEDLRVPARNIRNLRGGNATRFNIISALQSLRSDVNIRYGDAIVIYYAGHGATAPPQTFSPSNTRIGEGAMIQMILPSDFSSGPLVYGILDRTIGTILENVASTKGDNIVSIVYTAKFLFFTSQRLIHLFLKKDCRFRLLFLWIRYTRRQFRRTDTRSLDHSSSSTRTG